MQAQPAALAANDFASRRGFPFAKADFDFVLQFHAISSLKIFEDSQCFDVLLSGHAVFRRRVRSFLADRFHA